VYLVPDLILDYPELFSCERVGVHEGVHSWEKVGLGRRGVECAEEGGLWENEQGDLVSDFEEVNSEGDSGEGLGREEGRGGLTGRLSQIPLEILASMLAEQGQTRTRRAHLRSYRETGSGSDLHMSFREVK
jgi:hypothetical protein